MTAPTVNPLPALPSFPMGPGLPDQPGVFIPRFLAFLVALETWRGEVNTLAGYLDGLGAGGGSAAGALLALNNLADLDDIAIARNTLGLGEATNTDVWTGTDTSKVITANRLFGAAAGVALTDGATITIDGNTGLNFKVTLAGSRTLANPTNMKTGQSGLLIVTQDGTGSRVFTYGSNWKFPGGAASGGVLSTAAGSVDVISYFVRSDGTILANLTKAYS